MKKVKLYPALVISFILSSFSVTSSALEETFTYGSRPTTWSGVPLTGGIWSSPQTGSSNGGSSYTPPEARAAIAAQQKAAYEGQKAHCENNKARIFSENYNCRTLAQTEYSTKTGNCTTDSSLSVTLGLISASTERHKICVDQAGRELKTAVMQCNNKTEYSMCRGLGIL